MRVLAHPASQDGCRHYRFKVPIDALRVKGHAVEMRDTHKYRMVRDRALDDAAVGLKGTIPADVVVLQRPLRREMYELLRALQDRGIAVVVELDDSFHDLPPHNPAYAEVDPARNPDKNRDWLMRCTEAADWVTVSTPYLAERYGAHGRCSVIRNYVPARYLELPALQWPTTRVGWSGWVGTHGGDLRVTGGGVAQALRETHTPFHVIGKIDRVADQLGVDEVTATGWLSIDRYIEAMGTVDVGITPLKITTFNQAKSFLKSLEWSARGVPSVSSPTDEYQVLAAMGATTLAHTPEDWYEEVRSLILSEEKRHWRGELAKAVVAEKLTIESHCEEWWQAWSSAAEHRASILAA